MDTTIRATIHLRNYLGARMMQEEQSRLEEKELEDAHASGQSELAEALMEKISKKRFDKIMSLMKKSW